MNCRPWFLSPALLLALALFLACPLDVHASTAGLSITHEFAPGSLAATGGYQLSGVIQAFDGNFYGVATGGGQNGCGLVYRLSPTGVETVLHSFTGSDGSAPTGSLLQVKDNSLYGTTPRGGLFGQGAIYKITTAGVFTLVHSFHHDDGGFPGECLVQLADGSVCGVAYQGGINNNGTVYKISPTGAFTVLHYFSGADGTDPCGALADANNGKIYGTCFSGGSHGVGVVYSVTEAGEFQNVFNCDGATTAYPLSGLTMADDGNLYGALYSGPPSTIFRISTSGNVTAVSSINGYLADALTLGKDGFLYGPDQDTFGGSGDILRISTSGDVTVLYSLSVEGNVYPTGTVFRAGNGTLYGAAIFNGQMPEMEIYQLAPDSTFSVLYDFPVGTIQEGLNPAGPISIGSDGNFYGLTNLGGAPGFGTLYKLSPTGAYSQLHAFGDGTVSNDGLYPSGPLLMATDGYIYGTTTLGGSTNASTPPGFGSVFRSSLAGAVQVVHSFGADGSNSNGAFPTTGVIEGSDEAFYGTTDGSPGWLSVVYRLSDGNFGSAEYVSSLAPSNNDISASGLVESEDGGLLETTEYGTGSSSQGAIVRCGITPFSPPFLGIPYPIYQFGDGSTPQNGLRPESGLILASDGNFYGTTYGGGAFGYGTVFRMTPSGVVSVLHSFSAQNDGGNPESQLMQASDGNIYGTTDLGPNGATGAVFRIGLDGVESIIFTFSDIPALSYSKLTQGDDSALYGTTLFNQSRALNAYAYKLTLPFQPFDFTGDRKPDIVWQNSSTGDVQIWQMNDTQVVSQHPVATVADANWKIVASPDVDGDGHPDLLWWNSATGQLLVWIMDGTSVAHYESPFAQVADTSWVPVAAGDVSGDGIWSLIWQNSKTGQILRWKMDGTTVVQYGGVYATAPAGWHVVGAPDMDRDGNSDLLFWNSSTGAVCRWLMNDETVLSYGTTFATVPNTNWHLVGAPDLNDDGAPDLLWENVQTGQVLRWLMDDTTVLQYGQPFITISDLNWHIAGMR